MQVCFRVTLTPQVKLEEPRDKDVVVAALNSYLVEQTEFGATVSKSVWVGDRVVDLLVEYTVHITVAFQTITAYDFVAKAEAKPPAELGT